MEEKYPIQRLGGANLIESFLRSPDLSKEDLNTLNQCQIYLQVWTLSDIADGFGLQITGKAVQGQRDLSRKSTDKWNKYACQLR